jgi:hypothetical protein
MGIKFLEAKKFEPTYNYLSQLQNLIDEIVQLKIRLRPGEDNIGNLQPV